MSRNVYDLGNRFSRPCRRRRRHPCHRPRRRPCRRPLASSLPAGLSLVEEGPFLLALSLREAF